MQALATTVLEKVEPSQAIEKFFNYLDNKNYSECGKLLKDKQLGSFGYLAGSLLENYFKTKEISTEAHIKIKLILGELAKTVVSLEEKRDKSLLDLDHSRQNFIIQMENKMSQHLTKVFSLLEQVISDTSQNSEIIDKKIKLLLKYIDACEQTSLNTKELAQSALIDSNLVKTHSESHKEIITCLLNSLTEINKQDTCVINNMINSTREVLLANQKTD